MQRRAGEREARDNRSRALRAREREVDSAGCGSLQVMSLNEGRAVGRSEAGQSGIQVPASVRKRGRSRRARRGRSRSANERDMLEVLSNPVCDVSLSNTACNEERASGVATPCKVTPVILHGVVSPKGCGSLGGECDIQVPVSVRKRGGSRRACAKERDMFGGLAFRTSAVQSGITQLKAQGPSRTCNESKEEEEEEICNEGRAVGRSEAGESGIQVPASVRKRGRC